jgi:hypothetical protein
MAVNMGSLWGAISKTPQGGGPSLLGQGTDLLMGMLANKGQQDQQNKMAAMSQADRQSTALGDIYARNQADQQARDFRYMDEAKLGWDQNYLQKQMAKNIAMQQLLGGYQGVQPTNEKVKAKLAGIGWKPFVPQLQDGWGMDIFSRDAANQSLAQRQNDLSMLSQGNSALGGQEGPMAWGTGSNREYSQYQQQSKNQNLQNAIDAVKSPYTQAAQQQPEQKKGSIWGKILKGVGMGASFIPGIGTPIAIGATALGTKLDGGSWKDALKAGGMAAIPFGLGKIGGAIGGTVGGVMQKVANPMNIGGSKPIQMIGQQAAQMGQDALGRAIQGGSNFYTGQYQQPQGQMNLPSYAPPTGGFMGLPQNPTSRYQQVVR